MLKANNLVNSNDEFMGMDVDMIEGHLDYLGREGKYSEEVRDWVMPLAKKEKGSYLEKVLRAKGKWQDSK